MYDDNETNALNMISPVPKFSPKQFDFRMSNMKIKNSFIDNSILLKQTEENKKSMDQSNFFKSMPSNLEVNENDVFLQRGITFWENKQIKNNGDYPKFSK